MAAEKGFAFAFVEGALVRAVRKGWWLLLDEINLAPAEVCSQLASEPILCSAKQIITACYTIAYALSQCNLICCVSRKISTVNATARTRKTRHCAGYNTSSCIIKTVRYAGNVTCHFACKTSIRCARNELEVCR